MLVEFLFATAIFLGVWLLIENQSKDSKKCPPGPLKIPIFGTLIQMALEDPIGYLALDKMSKKYGEIFSIKMGSIDGIVVTNVEIFKELSNRDECLGRLCEGIWWDRNLKQNIGMAFSNGEAWTEMRKFCRQSLRNHGYGNREFMENLIKTELEELVKFIDVERDQNNNRIFFKENYFNAPLINIISNLLVGQRWNYSDPQFITILTHTHNFIKNGKLGLDLLTAFPSLKTIFPSLLGFDVQMEAQRGIHNYAKQFLELRIKEPYKTNPLCFTDDFLIKMDEDAQKSTPFYTEDNYMSVFGDLLQGASDTSTNTINCTILHLTNNPKVQKKFYEEIIKVCGKDRTPSLSDKFDMPYTRAVILEGLRWARVLANGIPKKILKDFFYNGYLFKKDAIVMLNFHTVSFDEKIWDEPYEFKPERFLHSDGQINQKNVDKMLPFGAGKRNCFGEVLAKDTSFLFLTWLIQTYEFKFPEELKENVNLEPIVGITLSPHPYTAILLSRNQL